MAIRDRARDSQHHETHSLASPDGLRWRPLDGGRPAFRDSDQGNLIFFDNRLGK